MVIYSFQVFYKKDGLTMEYIWTLILLHGSSCQVLV